LPGFRDNGDVKRIFVEGGDGQADTFDGDGSFVDEVLGHFGGKADMNGPKITLHLGKEKSSSSIDMSLYNMSAQPGCRCDSAFKIYR